MTQPFVAKISLLGLALMGLALPAAAQGVCLNDPAGPFPTQLRFEDGATIRVLNRFEGLMTYESVTREGRQSVTTLRNALFPLQTQPRDNDTAIQKYADEIPDLTGLQVGDEIEATAEWTQGAMKRTLEITHTVLATEEFMVGDCAFPVHLVMTRTVSETGTRLNFRFIHLPSDLVLQSFFPRSKGAWSHNKVVEIK